jgi:hypothetical protein
MYQIVFPIRITSIMTTGRAASKITPKASSTTRSTTMALFILDR